MKKFTLKELLDKGDSIEDLPENIQCWVDLPMTDSERTVCSPADEKSMETIPTNFNYRVCKKVNENGLFYSIRKVFYDNYGKIKRGSIEHVAPIASQNYNSNGLTFLRSEVTEYLKAFEMPVINLDEIEKKNNT